MSVICLRLQAFEMLKRITAEDAWYLGFRRPVRPEYLMITVRYDSINVQNAALRLCNADRLVVCCRLAVQVLPVPPPHVRPAIMFDSRTSGDDDLTYKYANIIRANNAVAQALQRSMKGQALGSLSVRFRTVTLCC